MKFITLLTTATLILVFSNQASNAFEKVICYSDAMLGIIHRNVCIRSASMRIHSLKLSPSFVERSALPRENQQCSVSLIGSQCIFHIDTPWVRPMSIDAFALIRVNSHLNYDTSQMVQSHFAGLPDNKTTSNKTTYEGAQKPTHQNGPIDPNIIKIRSENISYHVVAWLILFILGAGFIVAIELAYDLLCERRKLRDLDKLLERVRFEVDNANNEIKCNTRSLSDDENQ